MIKLIFPKLIGIPWKPHRSHWEILLVDSCKLSSSSGSDTKLGSLIIFRFDHALCDGFSIRGIFKALCQSQFTTAQASRTQNMSFLQMASFVLTFPIVMFQLLPINKIQRILPKRKTIFVYDISETSISMIKTIKRNNGVSFAAVLHSAVNASISRCLQHNGRNPSDTIDALAVLPDPKHPGGMCNHMKIFTEDFPLLGIGSSKERLYKTDTVLKNASRDVGTIASLYYPKILGQLPSALVYRIICFMYGTRPSYFISNFPATTSTDYFDGGEVVDIVGCATVPGDIGMSVVGCGINNKLRLSFLMDQDMFAKCPNAKCLSMGFAEELKNLLELNNGSQ
ncbi:unnamed protein product [Allacma fusca]|uniref:O-acyltransferase WSD1 C-terminal domain-containing protein n=1 Tax=Allacma fusca TaxID=39272 RepID=A0A8J2JNW1_9HEXA|nr:unnamed protein product [Allacma fusca]